MSTTRRVTIIVEVTDEDLCAGHYAFMPHEPTGPMAVEDLVRFHLEPAVRYKLLRLRSQWKWDSCKLYADPNLPKQEIFFGPEGHPMGKLRTIHVRAPVEGGYECPTSPTGMCWYDDQTDPNWDGCLFCGEPHERK